MRVEVSSARRELAEAVGGVRASEGRLTGGFAHSRFASQRARVRNSRDLKKARERIEKAHIRERSPQAFANTGVLHLLTGHEENAVGWLERAARRGPADAAIWSDLAAAYLARSEQGGGFTDLLNALEAADRAVETNPDLAEAQFNLAVALDRLSLRWRARAAWQRFLDLDGGSAWSKEARERFTALFQPGKALTGAGSPFELWARFWLAVCDGQVFLYDSSLRQLDALLGEQTERYPALRARTLWVTGLHNGISGRPAESLAAYRQAWEAFDHLGEQENRALVSNLLAEAHRNLGDLPGAWKYHGLAIDGLRSVSKAVRRRPLLAELGVSLLADDRPRLSIYVQEELLKGQEDSVAPGAQIGSLRRMAEAQHLQGNPAKVLSLIRQVRPRRLLYP